MCDPAQIGFRRPLHAIQTSVCVTTPLPTSWGIQCFNVVSGSSVTIAVPKAPTSVFALPEGEVCWTDADGAASCSNGASVPSVRVSDVQAIDNRFSILNDVLRASQSALAPLPFAFPDEQVEILAVGPFAACVTLPNSSSSYSCFASVSSAMSYSDTSVTENPAGFGGEPIVDLRINTTTIWWANSAFSVSWFGVPCCDGSIPYCSSNSAGDFGLVPPPVGIEGRRVSPGYLQACVVTPEFSLSCWGPFASISGWETLSSVWDVYVYSGGGCAVFESFTSATCWGSFSRTFPLTNGAECADCSVPSSIVYNEACVPCGFGFETSVTDATVSQSAWCVPCPPTSVRGPLDPVCVPCPTGFVPNSSLTDCIACPPSSIRPSLTTCSECGPASQSDPTGVSCTACVMPLFRSQSMLSCSSCPSGFAPNDSQTQCFGCPLPQYCSMSSTNLPFSSCTCVSCDEGTEVDGFGCTSCVAPFIRLNPSQTCYACPSGFEPNASFTACVQCTGNTVRTNPTGYCFGCPTGTFANPSHTRCESVYRPPKLDPMQYVFWGIGLVLLLVSWGLSSFNSAAAATAASAGVLCLAFGAAWPATIEKPNPT